MTRDPASTQAKNEDALILLRGEVVLTHRYRKWLAELLKENTRALDGIEAAARRAAYETDRRSALHRGGMTCLARRIIADFRRFMRDFRADFGPEPSP